MTHVQSRYALCLRFCLTRYTLHLGSSLIDFLSVEFIHNAVHNGEAWFPLPLLEDRPFPNPDSFLNCVLPSSQLVQYHVMFDLTVHTLIHLVYTLRTRSFTAENDTYVGCESACAKPRGESHITGDVS